MLGTLLTDNINSNRYPVMARGVLHNTFYVPEAPLQVTKLDIPLNQHEIHIARRIDAIYEVQFLKACFNTLGTRIEYNVDCFYHNDNIDLNVNHDIQAQSKGTEAQFNIENKIHTVRCKNLLNKDDTNLANRMNQSTKNDLKSMCL